MPARSAPWPAGTPCWTDIMVPDVGRTAAFYAELLGWEIGDPDPDRGYTMAKVDGAAVAGLAPSMPGMPDGPRAWSVYLASGDVDETGRRATEAGCETVVAPMPIGDAGRMGLWIDPAGAGFAAWQAGEHIGFQAYDVPGAPLWLDITTPDVDAARDFYGSLFGLTFMEVGLFGARYELFTPQGADRPAGGIGQGGPEEPAMWSVCFQVADIDAAAARVGGLGGTLVAEPFDSPYGRTATVFGPDGEPLAIIEPAREQS